VCDARPAGPPIRESTAGTRNFSQPLVLPNVVLRSISMSNARVSSIALAVGLGVASVPSFAAIQGYTTLSAFQAAIAGLPGGADPIVHTFDGATTGNIANGGSVDGITFSNYVDGGWGNGTALAVQNAAGQPPSPGTTSAPNYIGSNTTNNTGYLSDGDSFDIAFMESYAIGLWFQDHTGEFDLPLAQAYGLTVDNGVDAAFTQYFDVAQRVSINSQWLGWFVGIVSDTPFDSAAVFSNVDTDTPPSNRSWTADSFYTVPVPATTALFALGLGVFGATRLRRRS
jgi:hypothetical protein